MTCCTCNSLNKSMLLFDTVLNELVGLVVPFDFRADDDEDRPLLPGTTGSKCKAIEELNILILLIYQLLN